MMSDPVEFLRRKIAQVDAVAEWEWRKVDKLREFASPDDEPIYCVDDDYYHPLTGDPLLVIQLAEATRVILDEHPHRPSSFGGSGCATCHLLDTRGAPG